LEIVMPKAIRPWQKSDLRNVSEGVHFVGGVGGLTLHVKAPSRPDSRPPASWILRVNIGSQRRNLGLGAYPEVGLNEARQKALEVKNLCQRGIDPVEQKKRQRWQSEIKKVELTTFKQVADRYLSAHQVNYRNAKHASQWRSSLETYAYPSLATLPIKAITVEHVLGVLEPLWMTKTETASRLQGRLEKVFDLAIASGLRETNPARWRNYLALRLPAPGRIAEVKHYASLPYQGLPQFMQALSRRNGIAARALEFLILTAVRSGSVRQAKWSEIDFQALEWRIPKDHTKTRSGDHRVPLTPQMVSLLKALPRRLDTDLIFPSPSGKMLSDMALNVLMRKMRASGDLWTEAVPHGFRSAFRVWAAEATAHPAELAELVLGHSVGSAVYRAYQRSDLFEKRRDIMRDWNDTVFKRSEKVIAFA
jgi:integrase